MNRKERRAAGKNPGFDVVSTPAAPGHGCEWCPCTEAEETAHPEWHDPNRCPRNCTADADVEVAFSGRATGSRFAMLVCDEHSVSVRLLFVEKVTQAMAGAR
jgi:hypothetical protein